MPATVSTTTKKGEAPSKGLKSISLQTHFVVSWIKEKADSLPKGKE